MKHIHRAIPAKQKMRGWMYCVTPDACAANPRRETAHGNVVFVDRCRCGATREMESNCGRQNYGPWRETRQ
jgi:hypothetical protein